LALTAPIVEDDGKISSLFGAKQRDLIIVDRDFKIKFKYNLSDNNLAYRQITRYLGDELNQILLEREIEERIKRIVYLNVESNELEHLGELSKNRLAFVYLVCSFCPGCVQNKDIQSLKLLARNLYDKKGQVFLLLGRGNNVNVLRKLYIENQLKEAGIVMGVIQYLDGYSEADYYHMYRYEQKFQIIIIRQDGTVELLENATSNSILKNVQLFKLIQ
jgi:hypothetical protein